jgi:hypothetical protein
MDKAVRFPTLEEKEEAKHGSKSTPARHGVMAGASLMAHLSHCMIGPIGMVKVISIESAITPSTYRCVVNVNSTLKIVFSHT